MTSKISIKPIAIITISSLLLGLQAPLAFTSSDDQTKKQYVTGEPHETKNKIIYFDLPSQDLEAALVAFGQQSGLNIIFSVDIVEGKASSPIVGRFETSKALRQLLKRSKLEFKFSSSLASVVIVPSSVHLTSETQPKHQSIGVSSPLEETMVVSARRREESLYEVPISLSVISFQDISKKGIQNSVSLSGHIPNTTIKLIRGTNSTMTAFIRGIGHEDPVAGIENSIGFYLDDVYINRPQGLLSELFLIDRVEVLRGPQGTLYGRNTVGGAVKYTSKMISSEPEFELRTRVGTYNLRELGLYAGTSIDPINSKASISVTSIKRDGFGQNLTTGQENYDKDLISTRAKYEFEPIVGVSLTTSIDYSEDNSTAKSGYDYLNSDTDISKYDTRAGITTTSHPINKYFMKSRGIASTLNFQTNPSHKFTGITSYRFDETESPIDMDAREESDLDVFVTYENKQRSLELQYFYDSDRIDFLLGVYALRSNAFNAFDTVFAQLGGVQFTAGEIDLDTNAIFSDITIPLACDLEIGIGFRLTSDKKQAQVNRDIFIPYDDSELVSPYFGGNLVSILTPTYSESGDELIPNFKGDRTDKVFTPKFNLNWKPKDSTLLYATYREGFKGGGFDPRGDYSQQPIQNGYRPERIYSYELGYKYGDGSGKFHTDFAIFHNRYEDIQIQGGFTFPGQGENQPGSIATITNSAKAKINGVELNGSWSIAPGYYLNLEVGLLDARYTDFRDQAGKQVAKERDFPHSPDRNYSLTLEREFVFKDGTLEWYFNSTYQSRTQHLEIAVDELDQDAYSIENMGLSWQSDTGKTFLGIHLTNMFDERYSTAIYDLPNAVSVFYGAPRQLTASISLKY